MYRSRPSRPYIAKYMNRLRTTVPCYVEHTPSHYWFYDPCYVITYVSISFDEIAVSQDCCITGLWRPINKNLFNLYRTGTHFRDTCKRYRPGLDAQKAASNKGQHWFFRNISVENTIKMITLCKTHKTKNGIIQLHVIRWTSPLVDKSKILPIIFSFQIAWHNIECQA